MAGRVVHFEIPYDDAERARRFYTDAFGWDVQDLSGHYARAFSGPVGEDGFPAESGYINGALLKRESPTDRPVVTIGVDDIDEALAAVEAAGGMTLVGKQDAGEFGWAAYFKDVEGNLMGLWQAR